MIFGTHNSVAKRDRWVQIPISHDFLQPEKIEEDVQVVYIRFQIGFKLLKGQR